MNVPLQTAEPISFIVPVGNDAVYGNCLLRSPLFTAECNRYFQYEVIAQRGFTNAALAFNDALTKAKHDLVVVVHQDVMLPVKWAEKFIVQLKQLENSGAKVGVVGCIGSRVDGEMVGHVYHRERQIVSKHPLPASIQALDELLVGFRRSSGLRFDEALPSFFGYAPDICMEAIRRGLQNFVVDAPCIHETADRPMARRQMYSTWKYLRRKWVAQLPIHTPTISIDGRWSYWKDMIKDYLFRITGYTPKPWWLRLRPIERDDVLFADCAPRS